MRNLISVIIPSFNHASFIKGSVHSVLNQSYEEIEVIVIDDGSKDDSLAVISAISDPRIKVVSQENKGAHIAINRGLSMARGNFLAILNSDDEYEKDRLEICLNRFEKNPEIDFISTWIKIMDANGHQQTIKKAWLNLWPWPVPNPDKTYLTTNDYVLNALMTNFVATTSNMIFKREVYETLGGMRNFRFVHDWDFLLRVCSKFNCFSIDKPLIKYRIHDANTISSDRRKMLFEIMLVLASHIDHLKSRIFSGVSPEALQETFEQLFESMQFQGNDKFFWILYYQLKSMKDSGIQNPEEIFLNNSELQGSLAHLIET